MGKWTVTSILMVLLYSAVGLADGLKIEWYKPYFLTLGNSNFIEVNIIGRTSPGATVSVDPSLVFQVNPPPGEQKTATPEQNANLLTSAASKNGYFRLFLKLPKGLVQVPITVNIQEKQSIYVVTLMVSEEDVQINASVSEDTDFVKKIRDKLIAQTEKLVGRKKSLREIYNGFTAWVGIGKSLHNFQQSFAASTDLTFNSADSSTSYFSLGWFGEKFGHEIGYLTSFAELSDVSAPFAITQGQYEWNNIFYNFKWFPQSEIIPKNALFGFYTGIRKQTLPIIVVDFGNTIQVVDLHLQQLELGAEFKIEVSKDWFLEFRTGPQFMIGNNNNSGQTLSLSYPLSFEFQSGLNYHYRKLRLGLNWANYYHSFDFHYLNANSNIESDSKTSLFLSSLVFKAGLNF